MDNFFYGLQASVSGVVELLRVVAAYQLFWGFAIGFLVSTLLHAFLVSGNVREVPAMVFGDSAKSFEKLYPRDPNQPFHHSFYTYSENVKKIRGMLYFSALFLLTVFLTVIFTHWYL